MPRSLTARLSAAARQWRRRRRTTERHPRIAVPSRRRRKRQDADVAGHVPDDSILASVMVYQRAAIGVIDSVEFRAGGGAPARGRKVPQRIASRSMTRRAGADRFFFFPCGVAGGKAVAAGREIALLRAPRLAAIGVDAIVRHPDRPAVRRSSASIHGIWAFAGGEIVRTRHDARSTTRDPAPASGARRPAPQVDMLAVEVSAASIKPRCGRRRDRAPCCANRHPRMGAEMMTGSESRGR